MLVSDIRRPGVRVEASNDEIRSGEAILPHQAETEDYEKLRGRISQMNASYVCKMSTAFFSIHQLPHLHCGGKLENPGYLVRSEDASDLGYTGCGRNEQDCLRTYSPCQP